MLSRLMWWLHDRLCGSGAVGRCQYCGEKIYTSYGEHFDACPEFAMEIERVWEECYKRKDKLVS